MCECRDRTRKALQQARTTPVEELARLIKGVS